MPDLPPLSTKDKELIEAAGVARARASELLTWWKEHRDEAKDARASLAPQSRILPVEVDLGGRGLKTHEGRAS